MNPNDQYEDDYTQDEILESMMAQMSIDIDQSQLTNPEMI